jgi:cytochrome c
MKRGALVLSAWLMLPAMAAGAAEGDAALGARVFRACAACHSLEAGRNMTGPSLFGVWNRKSGTLDSFSR